MEVFKNEGGLTNKRRGRKKKKKWRKLERRVDSSVEKKAFGGKTGNRPGSTYSVFQVGDFL